MKCGECTMEFETKTQKDYHQKVTHRKKFEINGIVFEPVEGVFSCSVVDCSKTFKTVGGIYN